VHLLSPWWLLLFLPLAGLLILLYLLKLRRRNHVVPSIFLWEQALQDLQANTPLQKLRKNLLLFIQLIVLLLVVLALVRPAMQWRQGSGRNVVLIVDVSASMRATDVSPSRFAAARRSAQRAVEALGTRDRMMIVAVGGGTRPLTTFTNDKRQLREALNALQVTDTRADLRNALDLVAGITSKKRGSTPPEIIIYSDGALPPAQLPANFRPTINFERVGKRCDNVGIVMMSVRRQLTRQGNLEGLIGIRSFSDRPKTFTLELSLNGRLLDARELSLPAKGSRTEVLPALPSSSGVLSARLDLRDDLPVDNQASLILPKVDPVPVALATTGNPFLLTALNLDPTLEVSEHATAPSTLPRGTVLVADMVPVTRVPDGVSALIIGQPPTAMVRGAADNPAIVDWNRRHPAMAYVDLSEAHITKAQVLRLTGVAESLIETDAGPIAAAVEQGGRRLIYLGWDLHRSDFPLTAAFPIFVANCMSWLSGERQRAQAVNIRTGDLVRLPMPPDAKTVRLQSPDGRREEIEVKGNTLSLDSARLAGLYRLTGKGIDQRFTANLFDANESQLTPRNLLLATSPGRNQEVRARGSIHTEKELWRTLALLALLLLCVEWWIFHRRIG